MAFDGNGNFAPLAQYNPVVTDTLVSSTAFNATISDIAQALQNCMTRDGQGGTTVDLNLHGHHLTGLTDGSEAAPAIFWEGSNGFYRFGNSVKVAIGGGTVGGFAANGFFGRIGIDYPADAQFTNVAVTGTATVNYLLAQADYGHATIQRNSISSGQVQLDLWSSNGVGWSLYSPVNNYDLILYSSLLGNLLNVQWSTGTVSIARILAVGGNTFLSGNLTVGGVAVLGNVNISGSTTITGDGQIIHLVGAGGGKYLRLIGNSLQVLSADGARAIFELDDVGNATFYGRVHALGFDS